MFVIGLTGGIGAGKTEVSRILGELGAEVVDADRLVHEGYQKGTDIWRAIVDEFGKGTISADGGIDRAKLGAIVFGNDEALGRLNEIVHPWVRAVVEARLRELERAGAEAAVVEAALLVEAGWVPLFDEIWVTIADDETAIRRTTARSGLSSEEVHARITSQAHDGDRLSVADAVIENNADLPSLEARVRELWTERISAPQ